MSAGNDRRSDQADRGGNARHRRPRSRTARWRRQGRDPAGAAWSDVPIIVLSARDREAEKIEALDLGADDFVNKPFGVGELLARMRTALRHRMERVAETPVLRTADLEIDSIRHRVMRAGAEVRLTPEGIRASFISRAACRQGRHPPADPDRGMGAGSRSRHPISAGLYRSAPAEDRARSRRSAHHHYRAGHRVSDRRDRRAIVL